MKTIATIACLLFTILAGCSANPEQAEQPLPNCFNHCSMNFAACTDESGGDFADCQQQRLECRQDCEAMKAERRAEEEEGEVIVPTDAEPGADDEELEEEIE